MIGSNVSHYKVTSKLGEGGMGEVWRAEDTKLGRDVALKMLPDGFAQDPERLARFEREARVLASLSHPNIAGIHGLEEVDGKRFLVMELVEGQTLAERIQQGPMPIEEVVRIAKQIAEAVESAHEKGVVHRDLKPANVNLTPGWHREGAGFRTGQGAGRRPDVRRQPQPGPVAVADPDPGDDGAGRAAGNRRLHEPGAGARQAGRPARRHLGLRLHPLRDADRATVVHRRDRDRRDRRGGSQGTRPRRAVVEGAGADPASARALSAEGRQPPTAVDRRCADRPPGVDGGPGRRDRGGCGPRLRGGGGGCRG